MPRGVLGSQGRPDVPQVSRAAGGSAPGLAALRTRVPLPSAGCGLWLLGPGGLTPPGGQPAVSLGAGETGPRGSPVRWAGLLCSGSHDTHGVPGSELAEKHVTFATFFAPKTVATRPAGIQAVGRHPRSPVELLGHPAEGHGCRAGSPGTSDGDPHTPQPVSPRGRGSSPQPAAASACR